MPRYYFDIADAQSDPFPPAAELQMIEADSPQHALVRLQRRRFIGEPGQTKAWLRIVTECHPDGATKGSLSQQVPLVSLRDI